MPGMIKKTHEQVTGEYMAMLRGALQAAHDELAVGVELDPLGYSDNETLNRVIAALSMVWPHSGEVCQCDDCTVTDKFDAGTHRQLCQCGGILDGTGPDEEIIVI